MKKLLIILSGVSVIAGAPASVVSCTFGIPNKGGNIIPEKPEISIPNPIKPSHPKPSKPVLPEDDLGVDVIPDGEQYQDFVDPTNGFEPSNLTISALKLYVDNLENYINSEEYQSDYKVALEDIKELSGWNSPFATSKGDSDNEKMMRYFYLFRNNKFLQDYEKKNFDLLVYKAIYNSHVEIVNDNNIANDTDFIKQKNDILSKLDKYSTPNQIWANNTTKYFKNTLENIVEPLKK
ncbi:hypothetical protein [Spiroplasma endosymbiont of Panorpa germanica]|uniref:hypothetical protein n=1 Tax=Spiroplasma endosymbiont of Panorpa germanica TaxID=3066314 RepID=UPI0030CE8CF5